MLSKDDIRRLVEVFVIKEDLEKLVTKHEFKDTMDEVINKLDAVYGELKDFRQEQTVHANQHEELREDINHLKQKATN